MPNIKVAEEREEAEEAEDEDNSSEEAPTAQESWFWYMFQFVKNNKGKIAFGALIAIAALIAATRGGIDTKPNAVSNLEGPGFGSPPDIFNSALFAIYLETLNITNTTNPPDPAAYGTIVELLAPQPLSLAPATGNATQQVAANQVPLSQALVRTDSYISGIPTMLHRFISGSTSPFDSDRFVAFPLHPTGPQDAFFNVQVEGHSAINRHYDGPPTSQVIPLKWTPEQFVRVLSGGEAESIQKLPMVGVQLSPTNVLLIDLSQYDISKLLKSDVIKSYLGTPIQFFLIPRNHPSLVSQGHALSPASSLTKLVTQTSTTFATQLSSKKPRLDIPTGGSVKVAKPRVTASPSAEARTYSDVIAPLTPASVDNTTSATAPIASATSAAEPAARIDVPSSSTSSAALVGGALVGGALVGRALHRSRSYTPPSSEVKFKLFAMRQAPTTTNENVLASINFQQSDITEEHINKFRDTPGAEAYTSTNQKFYFIYNPDQAQPIARALLLKEDLRQIDQDKKEIILAHTIMTMIENVMSKNANLDIKTQNPFIAAIAEQYMQTLKAKGLNHGCKITITGSQKSSPEVKNRANDTFKKILETATYQWNSSNEPEWFKEARSLPSPTPNLSSNPGP